MFGLALGTVPSAAAPQLAATAKAGFATYHISWVDLQPSPGALDVASEARDDKQIASFSARGVTVVGAIGGAPSWAALHRNGPLRPGQSAAYLTFIEGIVRRYSVAPYNVHTWILWSEADAVRNPPDLAKDGSCKPCAQYEDRGAWGDDPVDFAALMQGAYARIKSVDPSAVLIMGPLAYDYFYDPLNNSPGFNAGGLFKYSFLDDVLNALAARGGAPAFDVLGVNAYVSFAKEWEADAVRKGRTGVDVAAKVGEIRARLAKRGLFNTPIMIGEAGAWSSGPRLGWVTDGRGNYVPNDQDAAEMTASPRSQAEYVAKLYARARDAGVAGVAWFSQEEVTADQGYGLVGPAGPKDAYRAYQTASDMLSDGSRTVSVGGLADVASGNVEAYGFSRARNGGYTLVVWARATLGMTVAQAAAPTARIAVWPSLRAYDLFGNPLAPIAADGLGRPVYDITESPVFFSSLARPHTLLLPLSARANRF